MATITIKPGDTLSGLAKQYGTSVSELMKLNPQIKDRDKIYAGAKLTVKAVWPPPPQPGSLEEFLEKEKKPITLPASVSVGPAPQQQLQQQVTQTQSQIADLQAQQAALTKYGLTDTNQLTKDAAGNYVLITPEEIPPEEEKPPEEGAGAEEGAGTTGVTTEDQDFKDLQQKIMNQILDSLSTFEQPKTISERYEQRQLAAEQATEKAKELTESRYKEAITAEEEAGGRTLTAEQEARRGFATNTALFRQMEDTTKKRVNDLRQRRDDALATQDIVLADKIDDLVMQEETAITTARTNYLNTLFAVSGELRAQAGFETPEQKQAGESARALQSTLDTLKLNYANVPGIENITSIAGAVSLLGPVLDEEKKRNLYRQDLQDKKLETDILLNQKKMGEPDLDWTTIIGSETDYRKEYQSRQVIKDWQFLRRQTGMMETAWDRLKEVMKTGDMNKISAARTTTDQVLGVVFQKMLDPTSVVRESEFARTTMGQAVIERAQSWFEQLRKGGIGVTDKLRQDLVDAAETLFGVTTEYKNETDREFEALVNSANERGVPLNIDNIIGTTTGAASEWEYIPDTGTTGNTYWYNPETMVGKRSTTSPGTGWVNMGTY